MPLLFSTKTLVLNIDISYNIQIQVNIKFSTIKVNKYIFKLPHHYTNFEL